ncbi:MULTISPECIES: TetR/AcrR family transcriptional regulator [Gordonia]|uniref:TetR family transcriptional regulator n=1 Tax=Gordonia amicalis TaxID=89053 RepID=A0ABU4DJI0_9ACTN|nr:MULTISPECIES: TetR family transcriptional regulator [Gordonia]ATD71832.1 TetR family transcriptional regulator [Gordonia sp. 1D]MBA5846432.1 TetR family transcriptional regulator [Gordonia amicalis]MCZ0914309.1 TetR family transcriptional regulator [Gordonia amicalis]MCZ4580698.1 TetR family transcriptional regulator [Gordonia amicalis]MDV6309424.1 TetR family transcriptional regulator [Gordonia amicalis]
MPRIQAPTVAEHRRQQIQAILAGAKAILAETGEAPTLAAVGKRVGLARSSVYQYYSSSEELLAAVVADLFPSWGRFVRDRVGAQTEPGQQIWGYICANVELFVGSEQAVANALARVVDPSVLQEPMQRFHRELQEPLVEALVAHGEQRPLEVAQLIDAVIVQACRSLGAEHSETATSPPANADGSEITAMIRRLLGGYLGLPDH